MSDARRWHFEQRSCYVEVSNEALDIIIRLARDASPNETGGTLVGYYVGRTIAHVTSALGVSPETHLSIGHFVRPSDDEDPRLDQIYEERDGRIHYLGEWHSHPTGSTRPSETDWQSLTYLARLDTVAANTPLMLVVGRLGALEPAMSCVLVDSSGIRHRGRSLTL